MQVDDQWESVLEDDRGELRGGIEMLFKVCL